jgi:hypothetical protein
MKKLKISLGGWDAGTGSSSGAYHEPSIGSERRVGNAASLYSNSCGRPFE